MKPENPGKLSWNALCIGWTSWYHRALYFLGIYWLRYEYLHLSRLRNFSCGKYRNKYPVILSMLYEDKGVYVENNSPCLIHKFIRFVVHTFLLHYYIDTVCQSEKLFSSAVHG